MSLKSLVLAPTSISALSSSEVVTTRRQRNQRNTAFLTTSFPFSDKTVNLCRCLILVSSTWGKKLNNRSQVKGNILYEVIENLKKIGLFFRLDYDQDELNHGSNDGHFKFVEQAFLEEFILSSSLLFWLLSLLL